MAALDSGLNCKLQALTNNYLAIAIEGTMIFFDLDAARGG